MSFSRVLLKPTWLVGYFLLTIVHCQLAFGQKPVVEAKTPPKLLSLTHMSFGGGNYSEYDYGVQESKSGKIRSNDFAPYFSTSANFFLTEKISLIPELSYVLQRNVENSSIKKNVFWLKTDFAMKIYDGWRLRLGTGWVINSISGSGGSEKLNNGSDENKDTYYLPSDRRTSVNQTLDIGVDYFFSPEWSFKYTTQTFGFFDMSRQQFSNTLTFYFHMPMR